MTTHDQVLQAEQLLIEAGTAYARRDRDNYTEASRLRDAVKTAARLYCNALDAFAADYRARKHALPRPPE